MGWLNNLKYKGVEVFYRTGLSNISKELGNLSQMWDGCKMNVVLHIIQTVAYGDRFCVSTTNSHNRICPLGML